MDFLQKLDFLMDKYGLNKLTLSQNSGIPYSTIVGWYKKGYEGLKLTTLRKLSDYFNTVLDYWVADDVIDPNYWKANGFIVNGDEMGHIQKYRLLDDYGKETVDSVLAIEHKRCTAQAQRTLAALEVMVDKLVYNNPAAAGTPMYAESDFERMSFPESEVPRDADFGVRISGHSMEPTIADRSIVWVHKVPDLNSGDVGVFMLNDSSACKRFVKCEDGSILLESDNPEFDPVTISEFDVVTLVGKVVGCTTQDGVPCDDDN